MTKVDKLNLQTSPFWLFCIGQLGDFLIPFSAS